MPLSKYNPEFGGKEGSAEKAYDAMQSEYGEEKGKRVFYGTMNRNKSRTARRTNARKIAKRK